MIKTLWKKICINHSQKYIQITGIQLLGTVNLMINVQPIKITEIQLNPLFSNLQSNKS
jgi:hypothetical protein